MIVLECEYCGDNYLAVRISSKYCSDSCKSMAYRKRKTEYEHALFILGVYRLIKEKNEKWLAEFNEKKRLESIAQNQKIEKERNERNIQEEIDRQEKKDKEDAKKRQQSEKRMAEIKKKNSQNEIIAMALGGIANSIIEKLSDNNCKGEKQDSSNDLNSI